MKVLERHINYTSRSDTFRIIVTSCWHLGNRHSREDVIRKLVKEIGNNDKTYFLALGDMCDYISLADIRRREFGEMATWLFDNGGEGLSDIARAENRILASYLKGLGHKCLGICCGNHEASIEKYSEHDAYSAQVEMLADGANEHRLEHRGMLLLRFKRNEGTTWTVPILATHGSGNGEAVGAIDNRLKYMIDQLDGIRLVYAGHWHSFGQVPVVRTAPGQGQSKDITVWGYGVPSLCSDMKYTEDKDKRHLVMGYWETFITPDKEKIESRFVEVH